MAKRRVINVEWLKKAVLSTAAQMPVYRLVKDPHLRDYLAIRHLVRKGDDQVLAYLSKTGRLPLFRYSSALIAMKALQTQGDHSLVEAAAARILSVFPEQAEPYLAMSDVASRAGRYDVALGNAQKAWFLDPDSTEAATKSIRLGYIVGRTQQADSDAILALQRFPKDDGLLWMACKYCRSREQLERIIAVARRPGDKPKRISGIARPLAAAALRSNCIDTAFQLYVEACAIELSGAGVGKPVTTKTLHGKNGRFVLRELREILTSEGVPFFFAAGTALGLVRGSKPLDHDDDIDVGIFQEHWNREKLIKAFSENPNFDLDDSNPDSPKIGIVHRDGASIDLFQFYREGDYLYHDAIFVRWRNSPFSIEKVTLDSGDLVYLPSNVESYLVENYGNWRVPDSSFDAFVDGPNVEVTWPDYMAVHKVRRAYRFIREADLIAARAELNDVRSMLEKFKFGREIIEGLFYD